MIKFRQQRVEKSTGNLVKGGETDGGSGSEMNPEGGPLVLSPRNVAIHRNRSNRGIECDERASARERRSRDDEEFEEQFAR